MKRFDPHIDPLAYAQNEAVFKQEIYDDRQHVVRLSEAEAKRAYRRLRHARFNGTQEVKPAPKWDERIFDALMEADREVELEKDHD